MVSPAIPTEIKNAIRDGKTGQKLIVPMNAGGRGATLTVKFLLSTPYGKSGGKAISGSPGCLTVSIVLEIRNDREGITLLVQRKIFSGLLLLSSPGTISATKQQFETMNAAIRDEAERGTT